MYGGLPPNQPGYSLTQGRAEGGRAWQEDSLGYQTAVIHGGFRCSLTQGRVGQDSAIRQSGISNFWHIW